MDPPGRTSRADEETYYKDRTKYAVLYAVSTGIPEPDRTMVIEEEMENAS